MDKILYVLGFVVATFTILAAIPLTIVVAPLVLSMNWSQKIVDLINDG